MHKIKAEKLNDTEAQDIRPWIILKLNYRYHKYLVHQPYELKWVRTLVK